MSEARDMLLAAGTLSEVVHNLQRIIAQAKEETQSLDWAVQRLRDERLALERTIEDLRQGHEPLR